jgi:predicted ester cyclase
MTAEENKALVTRLIEEAWNEGNLAVIDELLAPDYVLHIDAPGAPGREGYKQAVEMHRAAWSGLRLAIEDMVAEGDKVAMRGTLRGVHEGEYMGIPPTGKRATWSAISIRRFEGAQIAEEWVEMDTLGLLQQLGVVPAPGQ